MTGLLFASLFEAEYITTFTETFVGLGTDIRGGLTNVVPAGFGLFAMKYIWKVGKGFFTSLAK